MEVPAQQNSNDISNIKNRTQLSVSEAASLLGMSTSSLRRHESLKLINSKRLDNGYRVFGLGDILQLQEKLAASKQQTKVTTYSSSPRVQIVEKNILIKPLSNLSRAFRLTSLAFTIFIVFLLIFGAAAGKEKNPVKNRSNSLANVLQASDSIKDYLFAVTVDSNFAKTLSAEG